MTLPRTNLLVKMRVTPMRMMTMPNSRHRNGPRLMLYPGQRDHAEYWPDLAIAEDEIFDSIKLSVQPDSA